MVNTSDRTTMNWVSIALFNAVILVLPGFAFGQQPTTQEQVAAFKQSLAENKAALRKYQWVETTTVIVKGEVKSVKQNACYYGADGTLQKTPISDAASSQQAAPPSGRGGRLKGRIVAHKKEELTDYMKAAVELVSQYVPPNPDLVKYSKEANNVKVEQVEPNKIIRLSFPDFIKKGDLLSASLNLASNSIVDVNVSSYLESQKDKVTLSVVFSQLGDGTSYTGKTTLNADAKKVVVVIENSGYRPL